MFFFVPETFWDRTPRPRSKSRKPGFASISNLFIHSAEKDHNTLNSNEGVDRKLATGGLASTAKPTFKREKSNQRVGFANISDPAAEKQTPLQKSSEHPSNDGIAQSFSPVGESSDTIIQGPNQFQPSLGSTYHDDSERKKVLGNSIPAPDSPLTQAPQGKDPENDSQIVRSLPKTHTRSPTVNPLIRTDSENSAVSDAQRYTTYLQTQPPKTFRQNLKPWNGRLRKENWFLVALRPFILFAYPAILWSTLVYSLSIGWLIVLSESVSSVYRNKDSYNFSPLGTGLVYISPFIGGILGTAVAGKVSDKIVRFMSRRNGGVYEPEFRLVMAIPVAISTCIGLMGFGWSAQERDKWIVPTIFFGVISFGCALGSTTAITFAVDSYRQYAGEALVTLNFSKSKYLMCPTTQFSQLQSIANPTNRLRYFPWVGFLALFQSLARGGWVQGCFLGYWRHPAGLYGDDGANVYLWETGEDVYGEEEFYGEILVFG